MTAILHLSDEKGTEKRGLKIEPALSVWWHSWQPESIVCREGGEPASLRDFRELPGWERPGLGLKEEAGFLL